VDKTFHYLDHPVTFASNDTEDPKDHWIYFF
jgi:hypothetical protein